MTPTDSQKLKTEFKIISGKRELVMKAVQDHLDNGWELQGGISFFVNYGDWLYAQAITRTINN